MCLFYGFNKNFYIIHFYFTYLLFCLLFYLITFYVRQRHQSTPFVTRFIQSIISIYLFLLYLLYLLTFSILLTYLLLHAKAAPIDAFRHAIHLKYNIDSVMKNIFDK